MQRTIFRFSVPAVSLLLAIILTACSSGETDNPAGQTPPSKITGLAHLLSYTPYSFLEGADIWFSDPGELKRIYSLDHINNRASLEQLGEAERKEAVAQLAGISLPPLAGAEQLFPLDAMMVTQAVFSNADIPNKFFIIEGSFDTAVIIEKMLDGGYQKTDYKGYAYYRNDVQMDFSGESRVPYSIAKTFSRVAFANNALVITTDDENMNAVLDIMHSNQISIIGNAACGALAKSLGDVQFAVLIPPERIMLAQNNSGGNIFDQATAATWPKLNNYIMAALAFRDNGNQPEWLVSLYYTNKNEAEADGTNLKARLQSYIFNTNAPGIEDKALSLTSEVGEPLVTAYGEGATLTLVCRYRKGISTSQIRVPILVVGHDLLFLAPDASPYLGGK